jgi:tRNA(Ile)-lysidine synthase
VASPGPLLVAFSGGPDSVALTLMLLEGGYEVRLAYVNHGLRGAESQREEAAVRAFAEKYGLALDVLHLNKSAFGSGESLQAKARRLRYEWMESLLERYGIAWGVTAHTYDDLVETLMYQLLRGGDMWMFKGIPFRRGRWLRPLLGMRRSEVMAFLWERGVWAYQLDSSNYEPKYLRNVIRWRVFSALRQVHPGAEDRLWERYKLYRLQRRRLERLYQRLSARYVWEEPFGGHIGEGLGKDAFLWVMRRWLGLSWRQGEEVYRLYREGRVGAFRQVGCVVFCRVRKGIEWGPASLWEPRWPALVIREAGIYEWGLWWLSVQTEPSGKEGEVILPLQVAPFRVRLWRPGDRIRPEGLNGHSKKISDVWPALGLYGFRRRHAFVIEDAEGRICYAFNYRRDWQVATLNGPFLYLSYAYVRRDETLSQSS